MNKLNYIITAMGMVGAFVTSLFGGWSEGLTVLCIFMIIDFITGIIAALLCKSDKTSSGGISSNEIFKGIVKKIVILIMVVVGAQLDRIIDTSYIRDTVVIAYIVNETVSIIENAGLIGLPVPSIITKVIDVLKNKNEDNVEMEDTNKE